MAYSMQYLRSMKTENIRPVSRKLSDMSYYPATDSVEVAVGYADESGVECCYRGSKLTAEQTIRAEQRAYVRALLAYLDSGTLAVANS